MTVTYIRETVFIGNDQIEANFPAVFKVCPRCEGTGTHTNPNIDGNGITQSELSEILHDDPDFLDDYVGGVYDITCQECKGKRVVERVDDDAAIRAGLKAELKAYHEALEEVREAEAIERSEMRAQYGEW